MGMIENKKINRYIKNKSQVKLFYFEDEVYVQILKQSNKFILVGEIKDWHFDGYIIFPKKYISKIKYSKLEKFREEVMQEKIENNLNWLDITSYKTIFNSLKNNYNEIIIEGAEKKINQFVVGMIKNFDKYNLYFVKLSPYGKLDNTPIVIPKKEITCIMFRDEYTTKLFEYTKNKS